MSQKLFVGNLDFSTEEQDLRDAFVPFGTLSSVAVLLDRDTGRPRGFGFVEYESAADAQQAVASLDGTEFRGRSLRVSLAHDRHQDSGGRDARAPRRTERL